MSINQDGELVTSARSCAALGFLIAAVTIAVDQVHKFWMLDVFGIVHGDRVPVLPFLDLVYLKNTGVSYGWFSLDSFAGQLSLSAFAIIASIVLAIWMMRASSKLLAASLGLIIGGAIGNAIDRLRLGGVADFFSFHVGSFSWYVFNIADVAIVAGVIGILYDSFVTSRKSASKSA